MAEANSYQAKGVATVEMEASAMFAVATDRDVDIAAFAISDHLLVNEAWEPGFQSDALRTSLEALLEAAVDTLAQSQRYVSPNAGLEQLPRPEFDSIGDSKIVRRQLGRSAMSGRRSDVRSV